MKNNYASLKLRILAAITDGAIMLTLYGFLLQYIASQTTLAHAYYVLVLTLIFFVFNPLIMYHTIFLTYYLGGSLGKLLTGISVVSTDSKKLRFKQVAFRQTVGYAFSSLIFGLGYWSISKDGKKQGWHDKAIGTEVIVKQQLWPVALITTIVLFILGGFLFVNAVTMIMKGPLGKETGVLSKKVMKEVIKVSPTPTPIRLQSF